MMRQLKGTCRCPFVRLCVCVFVLLLLRSDELPGDMDSRALQQLFLVGRLHCQLIGFDVRWRAALHSYQLMRSSNSNTNIEYTISFHCCGRWKWKPLHSLDLTLLHPTHTHDVEIYFKSSLLRRTKMNKSNNARMPRIGRVSTRITKCIFLKRLPLFKTSYS